MSLEQITLSDEQVQDIVEPLIEPNVPSWQEDGNSPFVNDTADGSYTISINGNYNQIMLFMRVEDKSGGFDYLHRITDINGGGADFNYFTLEGSSVKLSNTMPLLAMDGSEIIGSMMIGGVGSDRALTNLPVASVQDKRSQTPTDAHALNVPPNGFDSISFDTDDGRAVKSTIELYGRSV